MQTYHHLCISSNLCDELLELFKGQIMHSGTHTHIPYPKEQLQAFNEVWHCCLIKKDIPLVSGKLTWIHYWDDPDTVKEPTEYYTLRLTTAQYHFMRMLKGNFNPTTGLSVVKAENPEEAYDIKQAYRELISYNLFRKVAKQTYLLNPKLVIEDMPESAANNIKYLWDNTINKGDSSEKIQ